jgi:hypothetical protein
VKRDRESEKRDRASEKREGEGKEEEEGLRRKTRRKQKAYPCF